MRVCDTQILLDSNRNAAMAKKEKHKWGGVRAAGPGKKIGRPIDPNAKKQVSLRVPPEVRQYLDTVENISDLVTNMIRRSTAFRDWLRDKD